MQSVIFDAFFLLTPISTASKYNKSFSRFLEIVHLCSDFWEANNGTLLMTTSHLCSIALKSVNNNKVMFIYLWKRPILGLAKIISKA